MSSKNYSVYFEIYGKKIKVKVLAKSEAEAQQKVKDKIIFHKIAVEEKDEFNQATDLLDIIIEDLDRKENITNRKSNN